MKKSSQKLFMMEMVLSVIILVISLSVTNLIFVRSASQHHNNMAMIKMSEKMVMISEEIQDKNSNSIYLKDTILNFDSNGNIIDSEGNYQLYIQVSENASYSVYSLELFTLKSEKLLSWDVVKVVK